MLARGRRPINDSRECESSLLAFVPSAVDKSPPICPTVGHTLCLCSCNFHLLQSHLTFTCSCYFHLFQLSLCMVSGRSSPGLPSEQWSPAIPHSYDSFLTECWELWDLFLPISPVSSMRAGWCPPCGTEHNAWHIVGPQQMSLRWLTAGISLALETKEEN